MGGDFSKPHPLGVDLYTLPFNCFLTPPKRDTGGAMEQFETRFRQVNGLPIVEHNIDELDLVNLFTKYVPAASNSPAGHA